LDKTAELHNKPGGCLQRFYTKITNFKAELTLQAVFWGNNGK